jgi:Kef-type K+ transport system membrane component KefB
VEIFYILFVLLLVTRIFGEVAVQLRQPPLVGELIAGICLGLVVATRSEMFPVLADLPDDSVFLALTDLGMFFLMLLAGIEMRPRELGQASWKAMWVALGGMLLPALTGFGVGWLIFPASDYRIAQALFLATALAITAVPVAVRVLMDIGQERSVLGQTIVSAAIIDDILGLVLLAILTAVLETGAFPSGAGLALLGGKIAVFFLITFVVGQYLFPVVGKRLNRLKADEFEFSALLVAALAFAVLAEALELHFIVGAFMAGLFFGRSTMGRDVYYEIKAKVSALTTGFLGPIFFASIGLHLDLSAVTAIPGIVVLLIVLAFVTKLLGAGPPAYFSGLSTKDAAGVGVGMSARGAVELVIAGIALRAGLFDHPSPTPPVVEYMFSAIVIVAIVTTLAAPIILQVMYRDADEAGRRRRGFVGPLLFDRIYRMDRIEWWGGCETSPQLRW